MEGASGTGKGAECRCHRDLARRRARATNTRTSALLLRFSPHGEQQSPVGQNVFRGGDQARSQLGGSTSAETALKKAIELDEGTVRAHIKLANLYVREKAYEPALALYHDLIKRNPKLVPAYTSAGILYDAKGDGPKANEYYQKALNIDPKFVPALNNLAWNYAEYGGDLNTALAYAQTAQETEPNNPEVADTGGWIYCKMQAYSKAISLLKDSAEKA